jgi:TATA-box binding protein (TBP) (component of TFIID and TFIIIB)
MKFKENYSFKYILAFKRMSVKSEEKCIIKADGSIKKFEDIAISTKTVIGISNLKIDLEKFFNYMPITEFTPQEKKRGRKKRIQIVLNHNNLPYGSIISVQKKREIRGACLKSKRKTETPSSNKDYFLHSVSLVIVLEDNKQINLKVSGNGKLQITGCKNDQHFINSVTCLYDTMNIVEKWTNEKLYSLTYGDKLEVLFNTVMQNMDFNVGFKINRQKLDKFIEKHTCHTSIYEGSLATGVNIKVKSNTAIEPVITKISYDGNDLQTTYSSYEEYNIMLNKKKETKKDKRHTFLVFSSGSVIMSSTGSGMKEIYEDIVDIFIKNRKHFEMTTEEIEYDMQFSEARSKAFRGYYDEEEDEEY